MQKEWPRWLIIPLPLYEQGSCDLLELGRLTCNFDARGSKGRISTYRWVVRTTRRGLLEWETNGAIATPVPPSGCDFFSGLGNPPGNPNGFTIQVELQVVGRNGERTEVVSRFVDAWGYGVCGYPKVPGT